MCEPSDPAEHRLCVPKDNTAFCFQPPVDPFGQPSDLQKAASPDTGGCRCEGVPYDVNLLGPRLEFHLTLLIRRQQLPDPADLPRAFDLHLQHFPAEFHDFLYRMLQIRAGCSHQQEIIHIAEIVLHPLDALAPSLFVEASGDKVIQRRQVDVGEPRRGKISDGQIPRILKE